MGRKDNGNYKRVEVLLNLDDPRDATAAEVFTEQQRARGSVKAAFVALVSDPLPAAQIPHDAMATIDNLLDRVAELEARITELVARDGDVWREISAIKSAPVERTPNPAPRNEDDERQNALSDKLKGMCNQFSVLQ